ncbi:CGI121 (YML036W) [Zygosaccharomyces parabailii]|nr:CGI121 (YML036W) [Zygosaccharomyces parabailii]
MAIISTLPQFPDVKIYVSLWEDVSNANELRSRISELPCALIDARAVCSREQVFAAIYRALIESKYGKLKTKSLHAECLYCLSPTSNIGEAFKNFGIKDDSTALIVIQILEHDNDAQRLEGNEVQFDDEALARIMDLPLIKKIYKLNNFPSISQEEVSRAVVNCIQLRGL